jgi:hypothetical protein
VAGIDCGSKQGTWNRNDAFWLVSAPRQVHFRFGFDGSVEMEVLEGPACKVAPVSSVDRAVEVADLFLRQRCAFDTFSDRNWKATWNGSPVPATIIDHPERITVEAIDSQPHRDVRTAMIESYGAERYWQDTRRNPTGFIHASQHVANAVENWGAATGAEVEVTRETLCEGDPRNYEEILVVRSGPRQVFFGEPSVWPEYRVFVGVSEGDRRKEGYVSRREGAERLLDAFHHRRCRLEPLPPVDR